MRAIPKPDHTLRARPALLLSIVALLSLAPAPARAEELRRVAERRIPFGPGGEVRVEDNNGKIVVEAWPGDDVRIQITRVVRATGRSRAEELMKELEAEVEVRKDRIDIRSRFPKLLELGLLDIFRGKHFQLQVLIDYRVQVPARTDLVLETSNGDVSVRGVNGRVEASTTNGDIRIARVKGSVNLVTTNGEVHVDELFGDARARTTNGSVVAEIRQLPRQGTVDLGTTNGNVQVWFDEDLRADLEAMSSNGRVSIGFPITRAGVRTARTIRGTIQGGGAKITLQTTNGNVEVRRLGDPAGRSPRKS